MSYRLTDLAESDIEDIGDYIAKRNPRAAVELVRSLVRRWDLLATQPRSGALRRELGSGIRHAVTGAYVTYYRTEGDDVEILRIFHGHREITAEDLVP